MNVSRLVFLSLLTSSSVDAACVFRTVPSGTIVVEACEVLDIENDPYVGVVSKRIEDWSARNQFLDRFTGVIISSKDAKFFYRDPTETACDALEPGDVIEADVRRECCDGGGGAPCGLGFDTYITEFEEIEP